MNEQLFLSKKCKKREEKCALSLRTGWESTGILLNFSGLFRLSQLDNPSFSRLIAQFFCLFFKKIKIASPQFV